jgi:hypothetical protein
MIRLPVCSGQNALKQIRIVGVAFRERERLARGFRPLAENILNLRLPARR